MQAVYLKHEVLKNFPIPLETGKPPSSLVPGLLHHYNIFWMSQPDFLMKPGF